MDEVKIKVADARKAYDEAGSDTKKTLAILMPTILGSVRERLTSYEAACDILGIQPKTLDAFKGLYDTEDEAQYYYSHHRITTGLRAINEGHVHDYNNKKEGKYYPWWDMETYGDDVPGSGFSLNGVSYGSTLTAVGARLSAKSDADARHIIKVFLEDYRIIMKK